MVKLVDIETIASHFESLCDPRHPRNRKHRLVDIIVIAVASILCGCDGPTAMHRWARERQAWLSQYLPLANGIPSRDCLRRLLMMLKPEAFQQCFQNWISSMEASPFGPASTSDATAQTDAFSEPNGKGKRLVAIDGKACRRSHDAARQLGPLHIVSAWASEEGLALGQVAAEEKSNEITAIPELLSQLNLTNAIVTIDAIGCQVAIVEQIVSQGGDFVIAVKDNQPTLKDAIEKYFTERVECGFEDLRYRCHETVEEAHGRLDERVYYLCKTPKDVAAFEHWPSVQAIGYALRLTRHADGRETSEVRYYIASRNLSGKRFAEAVRGHWSIESMHWTLDVTFREDDSRTRERTLGNNLSWLRRFAVTLLKRHPAKDSLRGKMLCCGYNPDFLMQVLMLNKL